MYQQELVQQVIRAFLDLYREKRTWIDDRMIVDRLKNLDVNDQFVKTVMSVLALFGIVITAQHNQLVYALQPKDQLIKQVTLGSLLRPFGSSLVA